MSGMIPLTKLWLRKSQASGRSCYSGFLGDANVLLFQNERKTDEKGNDHDLTLMIAPRQPRLKARDPEPSRNLFGGPHGMLDHELD